MRMIDITGQRVGRWTVLSRAPNSTAGQAQWLCRCDCGTEKVLKSQLLRNGITKSCGCLKSEVTSARSTKHGHATGGVISPTYHTWAGMIARCTNPKNSRFKDWGGRGITVCVRWLEFKNFLADMGEKPKGHTLERKNNALGYSPDNCEWATLTKQARNKRNNRLISFKGESLTLAEWGERLGLNQASLSERIERWGVEKALSMPAMNAARRPR